MKKERNYLPVMVILVLVVIGIFLWILLKDWHESRVDTARKQESQEWKQRADVLTRKLTELEQELEATRGEKPSEEKVAEVFGPPAVEAPAPDARAGMRAAIAAAMSRSKREIPHYYLATDIPLVGAGRWLAARNAGRSVTERVLMAVPLLKAVALALKKYPELNGYFRDGALQPGSGIHLGVAISLRQGGLIAPAIHDVDAMRLDDLMHALTDLVARARALSLKSSEMSDATVTVTNLGDQGVDLVHGVIYPPQVALVGFGKVGLERNRVLIAFQRVRAANEITQCVAAVVVGFGVVGPERNCAVVALQRLRAAVQVTQCLAAIVVGFGVVGLERNGAVIALQCLRVPVQTVQRNAAIVVGFGDVGVERKRALIAFQRLRVAFQLAERVREIAMRDPVFRVRRDRSRYQSNRLLRSSSLCRDDPQ